MDKSQNQLLPPNLTCDIHGKLTDINMTIVAGKWTCRICRRTKVKKLKRKE